MYNILFKRILSHCSAGKAKKERAKERKSERAKVRERKRGRKCICIFWCIFWLPNANHAPVKHGNATQKAYQKTQPDAFYIFILMGDAFFGAHFEHAHKMQHAGLLKMHLLELLGAT